MSLYLAVWDGVKLLKDLLWQDDAVFFRRQRVGGGQGIDCKHTVDVVKYYQVFLQQNENQKLIWGTVHCQLTPIPTESHMYWSKSAVFL